MTICVSYTYLCEDDFSWIAGLRDIQEEFGGNAFTASLRGGIKYCFTHEGPYFANFLDFFLNPYNRFGLPGFHAVMILILFFYIYSVFFFISSFCKEKWLQLVYLLITLIYTFCLYCNGGVRELFLWITGACNYTIPLSLAFITTGLFIRLIHSNTTKSLFLILACITGFLGSGGKLVITAAHCSWLLLVLIIFWNKIMQRKTLFLPFIFSGVGALLSAAAPGNFKRADLHAIEGHSTLFDGLRDTFSIILGGTRVLFSSELFILCLAILFAIIVLSKAAFSNVRISLAYVPLSWIVSFVTVYLSSFPIAWGAHTTSLDSMRLQQFFYMLLAFMCVFSTTILALWVRNTNQKTHNIVLLTTLIITLACVFIPKRDHSDIKDGYLSYVCQDIRSNNLRNNYMVRSYILETLDFAEEGSDVILFLPYYECKSPYGMGIGEDPDSFVNNTVENWKRIKSLTVYYIGLTYPAE